MISRLALVTILGCVISGLAAQSAMATLEGGPQIPPAEAQKTPSAATTTGPSTEGEVAAAPVDTNPYSIISERNCFRLNPPPPPKPIDPVEATKDLPQVKITGFLKNKRGTRALFAIPPKDPKDSMKYFNLAEGERDDILEVVKISLETEEAEILLNSSTKMTLSLKTNGMVATAAPANPAAGGPRPPVITPPPPIQMPPPQPAMSSAPVSSSPSRVLVGGATPPPMPTPTAQPSMMVPSGTDGGLRTIPTRTLRVAPTPAPPTYQAQSIHEAMQWQRELNSHSANNPNLPPPLPIP